MATAGAARTSLRPMRHPDNAQHHLLPAAAVPDLDDRRGARTTLSHFDDSDPDEDEDEDDLDNFSDVHTPNSAAPPRILLHPVPSMQDAFAESLEEATRTNLNPKPNLREKDAKQRREELLDQDRSQGPPNRLWRFRPGQRCHELRKLLAQISFGVELLIQGMANSNAQVLSILQGHIDEVDEFVEAAMEDVQEATSDLTQRLNFLKVPMQNMDVFEQMLENRTFRLQIVEGNVKIEHILARTSTAHTQTIRDISEGLWGVKQFSEYLQDNERGSWRQSRPDLVDVFEAMKGNTEGWHSAFTALESNSTLLSGLLMQLSSLVTDIDNKAGEVSRRTRFTLEPYSDPDGRSMPRSPDSLSEATPPPSPPTLKPHAPPRTPSMFLDQSVGSTFLHDSESPHVHEYPALANARFTRDSETFRDTMLAGSLYTPPESSKTIPDLAVGQGHHRADEDSESQSVAGSQTSDETESSNATDDDNDNLLYILQPRTYTPIPPAPIPSPRVSEVPDAIARLSIPDRGSPNELSIHIEAEEDLEAEEDAPSEDDLGDQGDQGDQGEVRETVLTVPVPPRDPRRAASPIVHSKPLEIQSLHVTPLRIQQVRPVQLKPIRSRQPRSSDKEVVLGHKSSLRERVSLKGEVPKAILVPPVNAHEFQQRPRPNPTPQSSPKSQRPHHSSRGPEMQHHLEASRRDRTNSDLNPPAFPSLLPSPASERQHFRPVQASPHSPLQQRPHTAGGGGRQPQPRSGGRLAAPPGGTSTLSRVMTTTELATESAAADSARTAKKKRSAFGWLKKVFSLDEEERAMFEARKRAMPVNYYQPYHGSGDGQSPRYLDGKRIA